VTAMFPKPNTSDSRALVAVNTKMLPAVFVGLRVKPSQDNTVVGDTKSFKI